MLSFLYPSYRLSIIRLFAYSFIRIDFLNSFMRITFFRLFVSDFSFIRIGLFVSAAQLGVVSTVNYLNYLFFQQSLSIS